MPGKPKQEDKEYSANWGGARGNLKGRVGRKPSETHKVFKSLTISGSEEEIEALKRLASESGKSASRFIIESLVS